VTRQIESLDSSLKPNFRYLGLTAGILGLALWESCCGTTVQRAQAQGEQTEQEARAWAETQKRRLDAELRRAEEEAKATVEVLERQKKAAQETRPSRAMVEEAKRQAQQAEKEVEAAKKKVEAALETTAAQQRAQASKEKKEPSNEVYRLRVGDELDISVWGHDDLNKKVQVREDGTFSFPSLGNVQVLGRALRELEQDLQVRLNRSYASETGPEGSGLSTTSVRVILAGEVPNEVYHLRLGDELDISVWGHDDLNKKVQIREDGTFSFPLIGNVQAVGRMLQEVEQEIQERLNRDYIVNPQVTVRLSGAKFSVLGEVKSPGPYPIEGTMDLLTAIGQAGGVNSSGSNHVEIIREQGEEKVTIRANMDRILKGKEPNFNILPRDAISIKGLPSESLQVTIRLIGAKFSVLGEVTRPGTYPIEGTVDLLTAVSLAGGVTKFGSNRIEIIREQGEEKVTIRANMDRILRGREQNIEILPRDTVYVRRRIF